MAEPADHDLWRCVESTVRDVVAPAIEDPEVHLVAEQTVALAQHARTRPEDPTVERAAEVGRALDDLADNPLVVDEWPIVSNRPGDVLAAASRVLVAAIGEGGAAADAVRSRLRPVLVRHVDDDLAVTAQLLDVLEPPAAQRVAPTLDAVTALHARARAASPLPVPLLDEAHAWLALAAAGRQDGMPADVVQAFAEACTHLEALVELTGPAPRPRMLIVGTALAQLSLRRLAELTRGPAAALTSSRPG